MIPFTRWILFLPLLSLLFSPPASAKTYQGQVVKVFDDTISASRYALMMLRHARTAAALESFRGRIAMPNLSVA